jgi:hypothetical protein
MRVEQIDVTPFVVLSIPYIAAPIISLVAFQVRYNACQRYGLPP